ncbi:TonB family protein [Pantoea sp. SM3]|uniref:TonB family protein n=1 Tax=Pantoea sp. SM3 TaxID=1628192 RepID=UPI0005F805FB|nr:TonB family protein [Pantoea sp. SM3]KJV26105.1 energy transducer TonB [Pantoea sp. SM3]
MYKSFHIILSLALMGCSSAHDGKVRMPKPLQMEKPVYPYYAYKNHIEGKVKFLFDVDAEGKVSEMRIIESTPEHLFDDAVIRAVSKWRFEKGHPTKNIPLIIEMRISHP